MYEKGVEIMKSRYIIGFFAAFLILGMLLAAGYQLTYDHVMDRQEARAGDEVSGTESIAAEGEKVKNPDAEEEGFYLCELQGFVCVYLSDRSTIYEFTEIPVTDLPEEVQQEVAEGKYAGTVKELYAFLENYSS